jgi:hypothetical protein
MVNIQIDGHKDKSFPCPVGWTVETARSEIRSMYLLIGGGILMDGVATASADTIKADGNYLFVNF